MNSVSVSSLRSESICLELRRRIFREYVIGERLPTEKEMSVEFGVAVHTVREAILPLVRDGVVFRRHGSGITVQDWSRTLPTAIFTRHDLFSNPLRHPYLLTRAGTLRAMCLEAGLRPHIYCGSGPPEDPANGVGFRDFVQLAQEGRLAGVIHLGGKEDAEWIDPLRDFGIPLMSAAEGNSGVVFDYPDMIMRAVSQLRAQGADKVAFIRCRNAAEAGIINMAKPDLEKVFRETVGMMGVETRSEWIRGVDPIERDAGRKQFNLIWRGGGERPNGLVVSDDRLFQNLAPLVSWLGISIPDELRIVTHANDSYPLFAGFPYTACSFDMRRACQIQVEILLNLIRKERVPQKLRLVSGDFVTVTPD